MIFFVAFGSGIISYSIGPRSAIMLKDYSYGSCYSDSGGGVPL